MSEQDKQKIRNMENNAEKICLKKKNKKQKKARKNS